VVGDGTGVGACALSLQVSSRLARGMRAFLSLVSGRFPKQEVHGEPDSFVPFFVTFKVNASFRGHSLPALFSAFPLPSSTILVYMAVAPAARGLFRTGVLFDETLSGALAGFRRLKCDFFL